MVYDKTHFRWFGYIFLETSFWLALQCKIGCDDTSQTSMWFKAFKMFFAKPQIKRYSFIKKIWTWREINFYFDVICWHSFWHIIYCCKTCWETKMYIISLNKHRCMPVISIVSIYQSNSITSLIHWSSHQASWLIYMQSVSSRFEWTCAWVQLKSISLIIFI